MLKGGASVKPVPDNHLFVDIGVALATRPKYWVARTRCQCGALLDIFEIEGLPDIYGLCPGCNHEYRRKHP